MTNRACCTIVVLAVGFGCGTKPEAASGGSVNVVVTNAAPTGVGIVGPSGGTVMTASGAGVEIPAGALSTDTEIQVVPSALTPPPALDPVTAAYDFLPGNLALAAEVTVVLPLPPETTVAVAFFTQADGAGWDSVGGACWEGSIKVNVTHLGTYFAAALQ
jgi:hypothetical protein